MADLLDIIAAEVRLQYLSDLHSSSIVAQMLPAVLQRIPEGSYSLGEWTEAVRYVMQNDALSPKSEGEARELLLLR